MMRQGSGSPIHSTRRRGFTLTELLIVIAIIGVLASLIAAAAAGALRRARQAAITLEINQLAHAVETFKNDYGAYPPNATLGGNRRLTIDVVRMFKKMFPRIDPQEQQVVRAISGEDMSSGSVVTSPMLYEGNGIGAGAWPADCRCGAAARGDPHSPRTAGGVTDTPAASLDDDGHVARAGVSVLPARETKLLLAAGCCNAFSVTELVGAGSQGRPLCGQPWAW